MEISAIFLADHASFKQGSLNILGAGYNTLLIKQYPYELHTSLVMMIEADNTDSGKSFPLHIEAVNEDGAEVFHFHGEVKLIAFEDIRIPGRKLTVHQVLPFTINIQKDGAFRIHLSVGDTERSTELYALSN